MTDRHARLSASSAHRWMNCAGSVALSEGEADKGSQAAADGTFAHHIAAECLASGRSPETWLGNATIIEGFKVRCDQEMVDGVGLYLDTIAEEVAPTDKTWIEMPLLEALQKIDQDFGGTADHVRYRPATRRVRVTDFKYGADVYVEVEDNVQLKKYALGVLLVLQAQNLMVEKVEMCVVQPRYEGALPVRTDEFDAIELLDFEADLKEAAARTRQANAPLVSGPWCKFCPVRRKCPELERQQQALVAMDFNEITNYDPQALAKALSMVANVKAKITAIEAFAYTEACAGRFGPEYGYKLVDKRPVRFFKDEDETKAWAAANAIDPYAPRALLSPAQLEAKVAGSAPKGKKQEAKAAVAHLIDSKSSGTTLVPVSDDRKPVAKIASADDFAALPTPTGSKVQELF